MRGHPPPHSPRKVEGGWEIDPQRSRGPVYFGKLPVRNYFNTLSRVKTISSGRV